MRALTRNTKSSSNRTLLVGTYPPSLWPERGSLRRVYPHGRTSHLVPWTTNTGRSVVRQHRLCRHGAGGAVVEVAGSLRQLRMRRRISGNDAGPRLSCQWARNIILCHKNDAARIRSGSMYLSQRVSPVNTLSSVNHSTMQAFKSRNTMLDCLAVFKFRTSSSNIDTSFLD